MTDRYCEHGMFLGLHCPECREIDRLISSEGSSTLEIRELNARIRHLENALEVIRDNPRFNNGVEACHIAKECLELMERASRV